MIRNGHLPVEIRCILASKWLALLRFSKLWDPSTLCGVWDTIIGFLPLSVGQLGPGSGSVRFCLRHSAWGCAWAVRLHLVSQPTAPSSAFDVICPGNLGAGTFGEPLGPFHVIRLTLLRHWRGLACPMLHCASVGDTDSASWGILRCKVRT